MPAGGGSWRENRTVSATPTALRPTVWGESARSILAPREELTVSQWAKRFMRITEGPMVGSAGRSVKWRVETFPLQRTVMEAIDDPRWGRVLLMTAPQAFGKTQCAALPVLLHALHHRRVDCLYVAANAHLAVTQWKKKIERAIKAHPELAKLIPENTDVAGGKERRDFTNDTSLHCAGSESVGSLAAFTAPVVICDDLQAYPASLPGFGHPADLAFKRSWAYPTDEVLHIGIGTAGVVDDYLAKGIAGSALFMPFLPCMGCGTYQLLEFDRLVYPTDDLGAVKTDTWMRCANAECEHRIVFDELPGMLADHLWVSCPPDEDWVLKPLEGGTAIDLATADVYPSTRRNTNTAGFWANALYWPMGATWGERVVEYLEGRGDPERELDFQQHVRVVPFKEPELDEDRLTEAEIAAHVPAKGYAIGEVPDWVDVVTGAIDVQSGYIYYLIRGWERATGSSCLIELATVGKPLKRVPIEDADRERVIRLNDALDEVHTMCMAGWPVVNDKGEETGDRIKMKAGAIDTSYQGTVIGRWHRRFGVGRWFMIKGLKAGDKGSLWPVKATLDDNGYPFRRIAVNQAKTLLRQYWRILPGEPGYMHMPASGLHANTLRAYQRHMVAEQFDQSKSPARWTNTVAVVVKGKKVQRRLANHFWDDEVYNLCMAHALGVKLPSVAGRPVRPPAAAAKRQGQREPIRREF